jgi:hypothetical protein
LELQNTQALPAVSFFTRAEPVVRDRPQTYEEQKANLLILSQMFGGKIYEVPREAAHGG